MLLKLRKNAQITLPTSIRRKAHLEEGDLLEAEVKGGEIILRPKRLIDKSQSWFWTEKWQKAEKEAQEDIEDGRVEEFPAVEDLIADLHEDED